MIHESYTQGQVRIAKARAFEALSKAIARRCRSRRISFASCGSIEAARQKVAELVAQFHEEDGLTTLGVGDIRPLRRLDLLGMLAQHTGLEILLPELPRYEAANDDWVDRLQATVMADIFLTSPDAVTTSGEIFSSDDMGNQVGGVIFGPRRVIMVVGRNRVHKSLDSVLAESRGNSSVIVYGAMEGYKDRVHLLLVDADLKPLGHGLEVVDCPGVWA
jgi:hypothetical protein